MLPTEVKTLVENDLPKGVEIIKVTAYGLYLLFTDTYGDQTKLTLGQNGDIVTHECADSGGSKMGTSLNAEMIMFMWRLSRMITDKPW